MIDNDEWGQISERLWKKAEAEGFIIMDTEGKPRIYCNREWLIEVARLFGDRSSC